MDKAIQFIGLWSRRDAAGLALKVGAKFVIHDLKAMGDTLNGWRGSLIGHRLDWNTRLARSGTSRNALSRRTALPS